MLFQDLVLIIAVLLFLQVNVVKGLKLYEDIFIGLELSKIVDFINELRLSGRKGELSGGTFLLNFLIFLVHSVH